MKNIKLAFFVDIADSSDILDKIKAFFRNKFSIDDTIVFSKDPVISRIPKEYGVLSTFYYRFYQGVVVFFTLQDYLEMQSGDSGKQCFLYMDENSIENIELINRATLLNIPMLTLDPKTNSIHQTQLQKTL